MKKLITLCMLMLCIALQAQTSSSNGIITGSILDGILNEPLPYVNMVIRDLQTTINNMRFEFDGDSPYPSTRNFNWESNTWNIALSYRFGSNKFKALQYINRDNNDTSGGDFYKIFNSDAEIVDG